MVSISGFLKTGSWPLIFRYRFDRKVLEGLFEVEQEVLPAVRLLVSGAASCSLFAAFPSEDCAEVSCYL